MVIALATSADGDPLLAGLLFAGVVGRSRSVVQVAVAVQDAGQKKDWTVWAIGDPLSVAGKRVLAQ